MAETYRCDSCGATFSAEAAPERCWKCASPDVRLQMAAPAGGFSVPPSPQYLSGAGSPRPVYGIGLYSGLYWGGFATLFFGIMLAVGAREEALFVLPVLGAGALIAAFVLNYVRLYRAWDAIQALRHEDGTETMMPTPGQAVGFLFIPFFNLYWMFVAYAGLANRMNKFLDMRGIAGSRMSAGLATTTCVLTCVSVIPYLGSLASLGNVVVGYLLYLNITNALNAAISAEPALAAVTEAA